ncbi:hypothetical protein MLD38_008049 [Melastoma candidum]|uniref:Uncharacterized protein n=1 Tax=Melastoma candidum TaxID=119954 RepID=A0ACB9RXE3_9MYRT|nr:hypothetical protein MLD38_008049 [Melastoma candidum]
MDHRVGVSPLAPFTVLRSIILLLPLLCYLVSTISVTVPPPCRTSCGLLTVKYPFGTGYGCGSPRFFPYVACSNDQDHGDRLLLTTHTGSYPITSISYSTSTLTISPPYLSTCTKMCPSPNLGVDWTSPFQIGTSTFILLHCLPPTSSLTFRGSAICDQSSSNDLCASIYACPAVIDLGLPLFPPTNTCCVYSPANFNAKGDLDLKSLNCAGYTSVVSFRDYPTDPSLWEYGVELKYTRSAFDSYNIDTKCNPCETSGGICGYAVPTNTFLCICYERGYNSTSDCNTSNESEGAYWSSSASSSLHGKTAAGLISLSVWACIAAAFAEGLVMAMNGVLW